MITHDPYGISNAVKLGKLTEEPYHAETRVQGDSPERIQRCLHCTEEHCNGACWEYGSQKKSKERDKVRYRNIQRLAEIKYNGGTDRFAMETLGLTERQIRMYEKTAQYEKKIGRLRRKRRANTTADG